MKTRAASDSCLLRMLQTIVGDPFLHGAETEVSGADRFHDAHVFSPFGPVIPAVSGKQVIKAFTILI